MKLLHTADWHIGQNFFGYDRKQEHQYFLDTLLQIIAERQVDALLIAGDIFDHSNPSAEAMRMYYDFLRRLSFLSHGVEVLIIPGNHDSAARLASALPLLDIFNVRIAELKKDETGEIDASSMIFTLPKEGEAEAEVLAVPYLRMGDIRGSSEDFSHEYSKGVEDFYNAMYEKMNARGRNNTAKLIMGHLFVNGSEQSMEDRSERLAGGLESSFPACFGKADYVALGHLHRNQRVGGKETIRYAGAPLPMSFAEVNYKQGVELLEIGDGRLKSREKIEITPLVRLMRLSPQPLSATEVLSEIARLEDVLDGDPMDGYPYLEIRVLEDHPLPNFRYEVEEALKGKAVRLARIVAERPKLSQEVEDFTLDEFQRISPLELAKKTYQLKYGTEMGADLEDLMKEVIREVEL